MNLEILMKRKNFNMRQASFDLFHLLVIKLVRREAYASKKKDMVREDNKQ